MSDLRKYIKEIILESQTKKFPKYKRNPRAIKDSEVENFVIPKKGSWTKDQKIMWGILNQDPSTITRFKGDWSNSGRYTTSRDDQTVPFDEEFAEPNDHTKHMQWAQHLRVSLKRLWEDRVISNMYRNSWWNSNDLDNQNVRCFHHLTLFRKGRPGQEGIDQLESYIQKHLKGSTPDLSTEGLLLPPPACIIRGSVSIELKKRNITWAGLEDQWTEFLSLASQEIIEKNPLGIKKHPNTRIDPGSVLFDPRQITEDTRTIAEVLIEDWDLHPDNIIIYYSKWNSMIPNNIEEQIEKLGIKYFGKPYIIIKN